MFVAALNRSRDIRAATSATRDCPRANHSQFPVLLLPTPMHVATAWNIDEQYFAQQQVVFRPLARLVCLAALWCC